MRRFQPARLPSLAVLLLASAIAGAEPAVPSRALLVGDPSTHAVIAELT